MFRVKFIGLAISASLGLAAPAFSQGSMKDFDSVPQFLWTGFYIGAHAGLATGQNEGSVDGAGALAPLFATDYDLNGAIYGVHGGYNLQVGSTVFGIEGTYSGSTLQGNSTCVVALNCERELDWTATIVARLGFTTGKALVYGLAGVAFGELSSDVSLAGFPIVSGSETHTGWTAGLGIEYAISNNIIARVEYAHTDFGEEDYNLSAAGGGLVIPAQVDTQIDTIKVGVSYKF